jgi:hypothetical protein
VSGGEGGSGGPLREAGALAPYPRPAVAMGTIPPGTVIPSIQHPWLFCSDTSSKNEFLSRNSELSDLYHYGQVRAMYKRKAEKVRPVDSHESDGSTPGGRPDWKERAIRQQLLTVPVRELGPYDHLFEPRYTSKPVGYRLTPKRLKDVLVGIELSAPERHIFEAMLVAREPALSWDFSEIGRCSLEVQPPVKIRTVKHQAWQVPTYSVPRALRQELVEMLQERINAGILEPCYGPYRNPWFLVKKKNGKHRFINSAVHMNRVTIRDALIPPNVDEFAEDVAGRPLVSLVDIFSGYDNITLHEESRDMTAVQTPLGLLRQTTLLQGATNSPAQFIRVVLRILKDHLPEKASPYVDNIVVKNARGQSMKDIAMPGVRQAVLDHVIRLDGVLADIERSGCTIAGGKSHFLSQRLEVVGYECGPNGRWPSQSKVAAILNWPDCRNAKEARGFLGVCTYYRMFIFRFAIIAEPIFRLLRKDAEFVWSVEQQQAMDGLKVALTTAPALRPLDYSENAGEIIVMVDASGTGFGVVLAQVGDDGMRHPVRYDSGLWTSAERKYDAVKLECRALLQALKKLRPYLYGVQFVVETDANTLVAQLNRTATDLPNAMVTRWLAWIQMFDFDVRHVPGKKNVVADALSRKPTGPIADEDGELDDWVDNHLDAVHVNVRPIAVWQPSGDGSASPAGEDSDAPLDGTYGEQSQQIARWLLTMRRPAQMTRSEFRNFKRSAMRYVVRDRQLFRKQSKNVPLVRVVDDARGREEILARLHDESGHRGREGTYRKVADRYFWDGMFKDVARYVKTCQPCQLRTLRRQEEALHPTWTSTLGDKWAVDVVHMPSAEGYNHLVLAREDISGWVEGRSLRSTKSRSVARFLYEDVICRHGVCRYLVNDGGPENRLWTEILMETYGIQNVRISAYHPQANGMVERGHQPVVDALSKLESNTLRPWPRRLHGVLWADRTTVRAATGMTPAAVMYGQDHTLPVELLFPTWRVTAWDGIQTTAQLLAARAAQLDRRDEDVAEAMLRLRRHREWNKEYFDAVRNIRPEELRVGDLVLVFDSRRDTDMSSARKLAPRWRGPFRVAETREGLGSYRLEELDGTRHERSYPGRLLKRFHRRSGHSDIAADIPDREETQNVTPRVVRRALQGVVIPRPEIDPAEFQYFSDDDDIDGNLDGEYH